MVQLIPINAGSNPAVPIRRPVILIGRHAECDVRIDAPEVSRRHCCVAMAYDRLVIRDLGSRNGVRVNGRRVEEVQLRPGDEVAIAQFLYRLDSTGAEPPQVPRPTAPPGVPEPLPPLFDLDEDLIPLDD